MNKRKKKITILGSTGSIGQSSLRVISRCPEKYQVYALAANSRVESMLADCQRFQPHRVVMANSDAAEELKDLLRRKGLSYIHVDAGQDAINYLAADKQADCVIAAIVGAAGLSPIFHAAQAGRQILLANKEALVMSGALLLHTANEHQAEIIPLDSEHNAIFQCLPSAQATRQKPLSQAGVSSLILTASGGPFRELPIEKLPKQTPEQACRHPNWKMGKKISVDSATMMNKGLEIIEACLLFNASPQQIEVLIHPQSIIHSMVRYKDGSVIAQCAVPDMGIPIAHALAWPKRSEQVAKALDFFTLPPLEFYPVEQNRYPCFYLAMRALQAEGDYMPTVLNAANEIAVEAFLDRRIGFSEIAPLIERTMCDFPLRELNTLTDILNLDNEARIAARQHLSS